MSQGDHAHDSTLRLPISTAVILEAAIDSGRRQWDRFAYYLRDADPRAIEREADSMVEAIVWAIETAAHSRRVAPDLADIIAANPHPAPAELPPA